MKKWMMMLCCVLFIAPGVSAQIQAGDQFIVLGGGYGLGTLTDNDLTLDGGMLGLSIEHRQAGRKWSFATSFGYTRLDNSEDTVGQSRRTVTSWPLALGAKWWLGESKVQGYLGAQLAVYFSSVETTIAGSNDSYTSFATSGWGLVVPVGVTLSVSPKSFINAGYRLNWLWSNDILKDDILHMFVVGLGFKLH